MKIKLFIALLIGVLVSLQLPAQYYNTGQTPYSIDWRTIERDSVKIIFPDGYESNARRTLFYMDAMKSSVEYGLKYPIMRIPVVFKTENFSSNGLAMWAPKRIEMIAFPAIESYSEPWLKQLATHEYRHISQYSNMNRHVVKAFSLVFGQQASLVATGLLPFWFLEGDATDAETQMSTFGRGLQPSFTMEYRAIGRRVLDKKGYGKWFSGSYRDFTPNHYKLGYQMVSWTNTNFNKYVWDDVIDFSSRRPYRIPTVNTALKKYYNISVKEIFKNTFTDLNDFWDATQPTSDTSTRIGVETKSYTIYSYPLFLNDSTIIAMKSDLDRPSRVVKIDAQSGNESVITYTGLVSSRPVLRDSVLYWTEYRESVFWQQRVNSQLCYMDLRDGRERTVRDGRRSIFPAILDDGRVVYALYDYDGSYSISAGNKTISFDMGVSLHGLDYDSETESIYYIMLTDEGMSIGGWSLKDGSQRVVKRAAYVTLSDLRAADGKLYFGSISSGKDEVHMLDLKSGEEFRITSSQYGSFDPAPSADGKKVVMTSYDDNGYIVAVQDIQLQHEVDYMPVPENTVNPPRFKWETENVDELVFSSDMLNDSQDKSESNNYRKNFNLFNVHSWGPIDYDPDELMDGDWAKFKFNISAFSQNLLSSVVSHLNYGYSFDGYSNVGLSLKYLAFAPKFEFNVMWEDRKYSPHSIVHEVPETGENYYMYYSGGRMYFQTTQPQVQPDELHDYIKVYGRVYLPVFLQSGYHTRYLVPSLEYKYQRIPLYKPDDRSYTRGTNWLYASLQYTDNVAKAKRDFLPRWGYALKATFGMDPFYGHTSSVLSLLGRMYVPGVAPHHSIMFRANYQNLFGHAIYMYAVNDLVPRGFSNTPSPIDYLAASADYQLPLVYPDWGVNGLFFLKRIRLGAFYDYAQYSAFSNLNVTTMLGVYDLAKTTRRVSSYGASFYFDTVFFGLPDQGETTIKFSVYKPSINKKPVAAFGLTLPL